MTVTNDPARVELPKSSTKPTITGLRARHFRDASVYVRLAELMGAAHAFDAIPWLPTAENLQIDFDDADGIDPVHDIVFVEVDGRVVASSAPCAMGSRPTTCSARSTPRSGAEGLESGRGARHTGAAARH